MSTTTGPQTGFDWTAAITSLGIVVAAFATVIAIEHRRYDSAVAHERAEAFAISEDVRSSFETVLIESQIRAKGVATAVVLAEEIRQAEFSELGQLFLDHNSSIVNVALIDGYRIAYVFPVEPNSHLIGRDLSEIPTQKAVLDELYRSDQPVLQGPLDLLQGMPGFIIRMPISSEDFSVVRPGGSEQGNVSVVIDGNVLLSNVIASSVGVSHGLAAHDVSIRGKGSDVVVGEVIDPELDPLSREVSLFGADIEIVVVPEGGWGTSYGWSAAITAVVGVIASLLIAFIYGIRRVSRARELAQARLSTALDSLADGFVLFDKNDRLILCNAPYIEMHWEYADRIKPGVELSEILQLGLEHSKFPSAMGHEKEWLARMLRRPSPKGRDIEVPFKGGRWYRILEKLTPDGGRVGLRIDITNEVEARQRAAFAEDASEKARGELLTAVETLPDGFVCYDAEDRLVLCNERYRQIYALSADAMVPGTTFEEILRFGLKNGQYKDAIGREEDWLAERMASHRQGDVTVEQQLSDGTWLRIIERRTPDGGRVGLRIDITEQIDSRRRAEKAERTLRDAINSLPAGFRLFDADGKLAAFNDYYLKLYETSAPYLKLGMTSREILEQGLALGEFPEAVGREEAWLAEVMDRIKSGNYEWEYPLRNGRWVRSYNRTVSDGGRVGIQVDITELRQQQTALQDANDDLTKTMAERDAAETRFSHLSEISDDWFWEQDENLRFTFISEGYDRLIPGGSDKLIGKTRYQVFENRPDVLDSGDWSWLRQREARREPFRNFVYRASAQGYRGHGKWVQISGAPIYDADGTFRGYRGVGSDISELYEAMKNAEAASKAKTDFLNVMSHELRTPLTVVLGFNSFLTRPEMLPAVRAMTETLPPETEIAGKFAAVKTEVATYAKKMDVSGKHLLGLINDMLDLAKIDSGNVNLVMENLSLRDVTENVCSQFELVVREKGLDLKLDIGSDAVFADEMKLKQILINLVGNAIKFTDSGSVTVKARQYKDMVSVQVIDTGCGIAADQKELVFEQFRQVDSTTTRKLGGTGLGLAIARKLTELMGGTLTLASEVGKGSTFGFTLQPAQPQVVIQNPREVAHVQPGE